MAGRSLFRRYRGDTAKVKEELGKRAEKGIAIADERKGAKGYVGEKRIQQLESIDRMLKAMGIEAKTASFSIWLGGNLPGFSGLGASAASSVAIARGIAQEVGMKLSDQNINEIAYEMSRRNCQERGNLRGDEQWCRHVRRRGDCQENWRPCSRNFMLRHKPSSYGRVLYRAIQRDCENGL
jgi:hypothetical protein